MTNRNARFGTDLRLLRNLTQQDDRHRGADLQVLSRANPQGAPRADLETLGGAENLQQALLLRFLTPVGELASLGHPSYGTRLFELIGQLNNETTRNRAKLYVLQALADEPRVKQVTSVQVSQNRREPTRMDIAVSLIAIDGDTTLNLVFPFFLEGGAAQ